MDFSSTNIANTFQVYKQIYLRVLLETIQVKHSAYIIFILWRFGGPQGDLLLLGFIRPPDYSAWSFLIHQTWCSKCRSSLFFSFSINHFIQYLLLSINSPTQPYHICRRLSTRLLCEMKDQQIQKSWQSSILAPDLRQFYFTQTSWTLGYY